MNSTFFAAAVLSVGLFSAPAIAVPTISPSQTGAASGVDTVHYKHSSCQRGGAGWHYHHRGHRHVCGPRPRGHHWGWTFREGRWGWWNRHERRWH